jgi:hypothetical protein
MIRKIKIIWQHLRLGETFQADPQWERVDEERLKAFFKSETGRKLKRILLNMTLRHNATAVHEKKDLEYRCGWASGFSNAVVTLGTLAEPLTQSETESEMDDSSELDRYSP